MFRLLLDDIRICSPTIIPISLPESGDQPILVTIEVCVILGLAYVFKVQIPSRRDAAFLLDIEHTTIRAVPSVIPIMAR